MNAIVCVSRNWGIGKDNNLLFHISDDMKRFRTLTTGKVIVMGHNTLLSLPGSKPLPNRRNIILSRNKDLKIEGATVCNSVQDLLIETAEYPIDDVFVIGGEAIYALLLPQCHRAIVTRVDECPEADTFFPDLGDKPNWKIEVESELYEENDLSYSYVNYVNQSL